MRAKILSPSAMEQYLECSKQYWFARESNMEPQPSDAALVGSCFHQAMEFYVQQHYKVEFEYAMQWTLANVKYFPDHISNEALEIGTSWLKRNQIYLPEPVSLGNQVFPQAEMPFGPPGDTVHTTQVPEGNYVQFPETGLQVHGLVDMIHPHWDTRLEQWIFVVTDWKTNRNIFNKPEFKKQSQIYALAVNQITGWPVRVEYWFIRYPHTGPLSWQPDVSEFPLMEQNLSVLQKEIQGDQQAIESTAVHCRWCSFNHNCPSFHKWLETKCCDDCEHIAHETGSKVPLKCQHLLPIYEKREIEDLALDFAEMRDKSLAADWTRKKIQRILIEKMDQAGISSVGEFELRDWSDYEYDEIGQDEIQNWGGKKFMPDQILNQIELYHNRRVPKATYLRHVG